MIDIKKINGNGDFCIEENAGPFSITIFGASGDLTIRKLIPSVFNLYKKKLIPKNVFILGCARSVLTHQEFRSKIEERFNEILSHEHDALKEEFLEKCYYQQGNYQEKGLYTGITDRLTQLEQLYKTKGNRIFYLATPPHLYSEIPKRLTEYHLLENRPIGHWHRVVFEKPFCNDLASAKKLNVELQRLLAEDQIYRIDHYLGKDTVQNILLFRFANSIFEPIWNRKYIDHIQISVAESLGVEHRAGYFEKAGHLRDMFQNHMLQMLALVGMEPPVSFSADSIRDEKVKLLKSIRGFNLDEAEESSIFMRGQYASGQINEKKVISYLEEEGVNPQSTTETFVATKLYIDNWRWNGVPFYLRAGKRLKEKKSMISVIFKAVPHSIFPALSPDDLASNILTFNIQPDEGISLTIQAKKPGPKLCMSPLNMKFTYKDSFGADPPEAYERLLLDCALGDQTLYIRSDAMELAWERLQPVINRIKDKPSADFPLFEYPSGSWGPKEAEDLIQNDKRHWIN